MTAARWSTATISWPMAVEEAEGMYVPKDGALEWQEPGDRNAHVEVAVRDAAEGRLIPGLAEDPRRP